MTERSAATSVSASRPRRRSPLAVLNAALASFLVVLALLTARVVTGTDPSLLASAQTQIVARHGHTVVRTTASGRRIVEAAPGAAGSRSASTAALITHASGGVGSDD